MDKDLLKNKMSDENLVNLQEFLNKCIKKSFCFAGRFPTATRINILHCSEYMEMDIHYPNGVINRGVRMSYHELFSKDSGIMEFVEWKETFCGFTPDVVFRYRDMSTLTSDGKVQYFLNNAILPLPQ